MNKLFLSLCLFMLIASSIGSAVMASGSQISLNVNGVKLENEKPLLINQTTMVPIRTISLIPVFNVQWDNKAKTVTVSNKQSKQTVKVTVNSKVAKKGTVSVNLNTAPRNVNGLVYVPLKFIGESLDTSVAWDNETKTAVIYNSTVGGADESNDIAKARNAVISLPRISLHDHIPTTSESHVTQYFFPYGKTQKFFVVDGDIVKYFEVKNHGAWEIWEAKTGNNNQSNGKDVIPYIVGSISKEWGKRPTTSDSYTYFTDEWMAGVVKYGILKEGKTDELGSFNRADNTQPLIKAIDGEQRTD